MEYSVEQLSPVKTRVALTVPAQEVGAALTAAAAIYRDRAQIDGFRKGKAPLPMVSRLFHDEIYSEARQDLINAHINEVLAALKVSPVSGIIITGGDKPLVKGEDYHYSMEFEVLPDFDLPPYTGLDAEETRVAADPATVDKMYDRLRHLGAKLVPIAGLGPAKDGQVANIDFEVIENGTSLPDLKTVNFDLEVGTGASLKEFEDLVKGIPVGNTGEKEISFPQDFVDARLAGKNVLMRVRVNAIKERDISAFDEGMGQKGQEALAKLRDTLAQSYISHMKELNAGITQRKLLAQMLKMADFEAPPSFVEWEQRRILTNLEEGLAREGKSLASLGKTAQELLEEARPQAEEAAKSQTLLMKIAQAENLTVSDEEVARQIYSNCQQRGEDFDAVFKSMRDNGLIYRLRDHMLADKGMDYVYEKANITYVDPPAAEPGAPDAASTEEASSASGDSGEVNRSSE